MNVRPRARAGRARSAVIARPRTIRIERSDPHEPGPGEVRVRLEGCGVCGSNAPVWEGRPWFEYPLPSGAPGHEGWGRIDMTGPGVDHLVPGDRVALLSDRAFAEFDITNADSVVPLPAALDDKPFPGEPLGCAFNVHRRARIRSGNTVAVVGIGFLGAVLVRLAAAAGARVIALSRRPFALELARHYGASTTLSFDDADAALELVRALTAGTGCDVVVEAVGLQASLDLASRLTRERGRLVIAGYHQDGPRLVDMQLWNWRGLDVINAHERVPHVYRQGIAAAAAAVAAGELDTDPLLTTTVPLDRLDEAFRLMRERPDGFLKAMVLP